MTTALAYIAQQSQAIDSGQLAIGNHQVVRLLSQQLQGLLAIGTQVQPCVAAHVQQHLFEQVPRPGIGFGNQHARHGR